MYKSNQKLLWSDKAKIIVICDNCKKEFKVTYKSGQKNLKRNGKHVCCECKGITLKPQNFSNYWDKTKKQNQGIILKNSDKYKESIVKRNVSGINNGMFNKKHSSDTINKMSNSRKGKIGILATAWKGGKTSINARAKHILQVRYNWFLRVLKRDNFICQECGNNRNLDAHHIKPFSVIIKEITYNKNFMNESDKFNFIITHSEIIDKDLKNGKTLCRTCHKKAHSNWGSHNAR